MTSDTAVGEGHDNPLQYSCLENPRDGGAWWAAVYGVAQSRIRLKRLSSSSSRYWRVGSYSNEMDVPWQAWNIFYLRDCHPWNWLSLILQSVLPCTFKIIVVGQLLSHPALWDPMNCSTPSFPVLNHLLESAQSHVCWVNDAIQPPHPLLCPSPSAFNLPQHQGLFQNESILHIRWLKY